MRSYQQAIEDRRTPDKSIFRSLVTLYKASDSYAPLSNSTKKNWSRCLGDIGEYFGELRIAQFDRPEKIRPVIRQWRNQFVETPRTADYKMQVLSRVLSYAVELGKVAGNPCEGIKPLYKSDRSEIIWTPTHIASLKTACSAEIAHAVDLAAHTGLRLGDLLRLSWSHVSADAIEITTGKSKQRRIAIIPIYDDLRAVLSAIPKRSTIILTSSKGRPWTQDGFGSSFNKAKSTAGLADANLHFHDLRGTAATRFYIAGVPQRVIAEIMAWEEEHIAKIIRRYVDRGAATKALIRQLNERRT